MTASTGRQLLDEAEMFDQMTVFAARRFGLSTINAIRSLDQGIVLVHYALLHPEQVLSPSTAVDLGVDAFVLHMPEYRAFCFRTAGRLLDHIPRKGAGTMEAPDGRPVVGPFATAELLRADGSYLIDPSMWPRSETDPDCCFMCTGGPSAAAVQGTLSIPVA